MYFASFLLVERLQNEARRRKVGMHRRIYTHIEELFQDYPGATAYFNCAGVGAAKLKGVEDNKVYPTKVSVNEYLLGRGFNLMINKGPSSPRRIP
jgi:hypothetical protein